MLDFDDVTDIDAGDFGGLYISSRLHGLTDLLTSRLLINHNNVFNPFQSVHSRIHTLPVSFML